MKLYLLLFLAAACSAIKPNYGERLSNLKTISPAVLKKYLPAERFRKAAKQYIPPLESDVPKTNIEKSNQLTADPKTINHSQPKETVVKYIPPNNNDYQQQYRYKPIYIDTDYNPQIHTTEDRFVPQFESKKNIAPLQKKYQPYLPPIDPQFDQIFNQYLNSLEQQLPVQYTPQNKISSKSDIESNYPAIVEKYVQPFVEILPEKYSTQAPIESKSYQPKQSIEIQKPSIEYLPPYFSMPENDLISPSPYTIRRYDSQLQQAAYQYPYTTQDQFTNENYPQGPMTPKPHLSTTAKSMYQDMTTAISRQPSTTASYQQNYNKPIESSTARPYYNQQSTTSKPYQVQEVSTSTPYYNQQSNTNQNYIHKPYQSQEVSTSTQYYQQSNTNNQNYKAQEFSTATPYYTQPPSTQSNSQNYNKQETYFNQPTTTPQTFINTANYNQQNITPSPYSNQQSTTKSYMNNPYLYPQPSTTSIPKPYFNQQSTTIKPYYNSESLKNNSVVNVFKTEMYRQNQPNNYYNNQDTNMIYNQYAESRNNNGANRMYGERIIPTPPLYASSRSSNSPMVNIQTGNQQQPQSFDSHSETSDLTPINFLPQIPSQFKAPKPIVSTPNPFIKQQYSNLPQYQVTYEQQNHGPVTEAVPILRQTAEMEPDGSFSYETLTGDQTHIMQQGHILNAGTDHEEQVIQGSYSYLGADGITYTVNYIADSNGFRATGDHLPTAPPIPDVIQRSIEYNIAEEAALAESNQHLTIAAPNQQSYQYPQQQIDNSNKYQNQPQPSQRRSNQQSNQYPQQQIDHSRSYQNQPQAQKRSSNQQAYQYPQMDNAKINQIQTQSQDANHIYPRVDNTKNNQIQTQAQDRSLHQQSYQYSQINNAKNNQIQSQSQDSNYTNTKVDIAKNNQIQPHSQEVNSKQQSYQHPQQIPPQASETSSLSQEVAPLQLNYNI